MRVSLRGLPRASAGSNSYSYDAVLEWVSIYWFSRAGPAASVRIYYEMAGGNGSNDQILRGTGGGSVPVGLSYFPREVFHVPKSCVSLVPSLRSLGSCESVS